MWLKNYIFLRMLPNNKKGGQAGAAFATFVVSAIWHGFYPGFFSFFIAAGLLDYQAKMAGKAMMPLVEKWIPGWLLYILCYVWCYMMCGYFGTAFVLLTYENFNKVYSSMYYVLHIVLAVSIVACHILTPEQKSTKTGGSDSKQAESKSKQE